HSSIACPPPRPECRTDGAGASPNVATRSSGPSPPSQLCREVQHHADHKSLPLAVFRLSRTSRTGCYAAWTLRMPSPSGFRTGSSTSERTAMIGRCRLVLKRVRFGLALATFVSLAAPSFGQEVAPQGAGENPLVNGDPNVAALQAEIAALQSQL